MIKGVPVAAGVYRIVNLVTGGSYVGSSRNLRRRFARHLTDLRRGRHHADYLQRSWNKHGEAAFRFEILELVISDPILLAVREQHHLDKCGKSYNGLRNAYSSLDQPLSFEHKAKISAALRGKPFSEERKKRIAAANRARRGIRHSAETKERMRAAHRGRKRRPTSEETKARISAAKRGKPGKPLTTEHRQKLEAGHRDYWTRRRAEVGA
jgi:group I intron endonuclease